MTQKEFGKANYYATRMGGVVTLFATGTLSKWTDRPYFEQMPFFIFPPMFGFYIDREQIGINLLRPFTKAQIISYPYEVDYININDIDGSHNVVINSLINSVEIENEQLQDNLCVYNRIGTDSYLIATADAILIAVYQKVFGPATKPECEDYINSHAGV